MARRWTLGERLGQARQRRFVGRRAELDLFAAALSAPEPPFTVLHVHGPGGVGKSALLQSFAELARDAGAVPVRLDARHCEPTPVGLLAGLRRALELPEDDLLDPPPFLVSPILMMRVLRANLRRRRETPRALDRPSMASPAG